MGVHERGWECAVKPMRQRHHPKKGRQVEQETKLVEDKPVLYEFGHTKRWWIHNFPTRFQPNYLRALLSAERLKRPIDHLRSDEFYLAMLEGREYAGAEMHVGFQKPGGEDVVPQRRAGKQSRRASRLVGEAKPAIEDEADLDRCSSQRDPCG